MTPSGGSRRESPLADRPHLAQTVPMDQRIPFAAGLCASCRHARAVSNDRGSRFVLCGRAGDDARYPRYPPLPVLSCPGYEPVDPPALASDAPPA